MAIAETIYVLGAGAIGFPLAAVLAADGRRVVAVRTSRAAEAGTTRTIKLHHGASRRSTPVETTALASLARLDGLLVVAAKVYANPVLARELKARGADGPVVLLQNGLGVERPFVDAGFRSIYRCVLYVTSQALGDDEYSFRTVMPSPIGISSGSEAELRRCVAALTTEVFPFRVELAIQREVWKKAIINAVFNSICPLLDVDNGVFAREPAVAELARELVGECVAVTERLGLGLTEQEIVDQLLRISRSSDGQLISTLQDLRHGRPTEIDFLNLEIARIAADLTPRIPVPRTELLGRLIAAKSLLANGASHRGG